MIILISNACIRSIDGTTYRKRDIRRLAAVGQPTLTTEGFDAECDVTR